MNERRPTGPAQPDEVERPEDDALAWRDKDGRPHEGPKTEKNTTDAEKADKDEDKNDMPSSFVQMPPD